MYDLCLLLANTHRRHHVKDSYKVKSRTVQHTLSKKAGDLPTS
jgi:hypothetical protein